MPPRVLRRSSIPSSHGTLVVIVAAGPWPIATPETTLRTGRPPRLLRAEVLPLLVEELDRLIHHRLVLHVRPATRNMAKNVPSMLAIGFAVGETAQSTHDG